MTEQSVDSTMASFRVATGSLWKLVHLAGHTYEARVNCIATYLGQVAEILAYPFLDDDALDAVSHPFGWEQLSADIDAWCEEQSDVLEAIIRKAERAKDVVGSAL